MELEKEREQLRYRIEVLQNYGMRELDRLQEVEEKLTKKT